MADEGHKTHKLIIHQSKSPQNIQDKTSIRNSSAGSLTKHRPKQLAHTVYLQLQVHL